MDTLYFILYTQGLKCIYLLDSFQWILYTLHSRVEAHICWIVSSGYFILYTLHSRVEAHISRIVSSGSSGYPHRDTGEVEPSQSVEVLLSFLTLTWNYTIHKNHTFQNGYHPSNPAWHNREDRCSSSGFEIHQNVRSWNVPWSLILILFMKINRASWAEGNINNKMFCQQILNTRTD